MGMAVSSGKGGGGGRRGGRRRGGKGGGPIAEINVTPMVDVMLVLLIIFMVAAPLMTVGVPVDLPQTKARENECGDAADHHFCEQGRRDLSAGNADPDR